MPPRRVIIALTIALAWCWSVWHSDLEGAGLMFEHEHHHAAHHDAGEPGSHEHTSLTGDDHKPVWARDQIQASLGFIFSQLLLAAFALVGLWALIFDFGANRDALRPAPKRRTRSFDPIWQFVQRCAPDAVAPPALS